MSKYKIEGEIDPLDLEAMRDIIEQLRGIASVDVAKVTVESRTVINLA